MTTCYHFYQGICPCSPYGFRDWCPFICFAAKFSNCFRFKETITLTVVGEILNADLSVFVHFFFNMLFFFFLFSSCSECHCSCYRWNCQSFFFHMGFKAFSPLGRSSGGRSSFPLLKQLVFSRNFLLAFIPELIWLELELVESFWHCFSWENADLSKLKQFVEMYQFPLNFHQETVVFFFPSSGWNFWYGSDRKRNH